MTELPGKRGKKQNMLFLKAKTYVKMLFLGKYVKTYFICESHFFPTSNHYPSLIF